MRRSIYFRLLIPLIVGLAGLTGCGFSVRGQNADYSFQSIVVEGSQGVAQELLFVLSNQRNITISRDQKQAQIRLAVTSQTVDRTVIAFNAAGRPREILLRMRVSYRITDQFGVQISEQTEIFQTRELTINEAEILSAPLSEGSLVEDMQKDIAWQILRRLRSVKLPG